MDDFRIVVAWKAERYVGQSLIAQFSAKNNRWSETYLCIYYDRGVNIGGKVIWIGVRYDDEGDDEQIIISFDVTNNVSNCHEIDIDEEGQPGHICAVDGKLAVVFRSFVFIREVASFLWMSGVDPFPINQVNYTCVKQMNVMSQNFHFIGYQDGRFVFTNHFNGDVYFCDGEVYMIENLEDYSPDHYYVQSIDDFNFSTRVF